MVTRACLASAAIAIFTVASQPVAAPPALAQSWQEYQNEDLRFKIEIPGKPEVRHENGAVEVEVDYENIKFGISDFQRPKPLLNKPLASRLRKYCEDVRVATEKALGVKVTRVNQFRVDTNPTCELIVETDGFHLISRTFVLQDRTIQISATSLHSIEDNAVVQRFMRSFKLQPRAG
jgi:hypothetical protein